MNRTSLLGLATLFLASLALSACGSCGDKTPEPAPLEREPEPTNFGALPDATNPFSTPPAVASLGVPTVLLPAKVPLVIRLRSANRVDKLLQAYSAERTAVGGTALSIGADSAIGAVLGFDPSEWIAKDKPATLFFVDPARFVLGEVLVLGIHDTDALLRALPKGGFDQDEVRPEGHSAVYYTKTGMLYVDFLGSQVVFTKHNDVFGTVKDFIGGGLAAWKAEHDCEVLVDVPNLRTAFAKEIELSRADPTPQGKRGSGVPLLSKAALVGLADGFDRLSAQVNLAAGHFKVNVSAQHAEAPSGTMKGIADWTTALASRTTAPMAGLPAGVWGAASLSADLGGEVFKPLREAGSALVTSLYGDLLDLTPAEREASAPLWGRFSDLIQGGLYTFAFEQGEVPLCAALVVEVNDAHRARFLTKRLLETFLLRIIPRIQDEEIPIAEMPFPDGDFRTIGELFAELNEVYQQLGIRFYERSHINAAQDLAVEALGITFSSAKRSEAAKAGEKNLAEIFGSQLELAMAFRGNLVALVLSPTASNQAALLASGAFGKGAGPFRTILAGEAATVALALDRVLTSVPQLWPHARDFVTPDQVLGDASLGFRAHGRNLEAVLSLPVRTISLLEAIHGVAGRKPTTRPQPKPRP